jgi:hypothetical protein
MKETLQYMLGFPQPVDMSETDAATQQGLTCFKSYQAFLSLQRRRFSDKKWCLAADMVPKLRMEVRIEAAAAHLQG